LLTGAPVPFTLVLEPRPMPAMPPRLPVIVTLMSSLLRSNPKAEPAMKGESNAPVETLVLKAMPEISPTLAPKVFALVVTMKELPAATLSVTGPAAVSSVTPLVAV